MMSKITFCNENLILSSSLSVISGTENAQFPISNLKHAFTTKVFRSTGTSVDILIDLGTMRQVDIICIKGSSVTKIGFNTATIEGSPTPVFNNTPISIDISSAHNFAFSEFAPVSHRYWKLTLTGTDYVELSNVFLGEKIQLIDNNLSTGFSYVSNTNSKISKNAYSQKFIDTFNTVDTLSGTIELLNSEEFEILNGLNSTNRPLWFLLDPLGSMDITDSQFLFSGYFYMNDLNFKNIAPGLYEVAISLEEAT